MQKIAKALRNIGVIVLLLCVIFGLYIAFFADHEAWEKAFRVESVWFVYFAISFFAVSPFLFFWQFFRHFWKCMRCALSFFSYVVSPLARIGGRQMSSAEKVDLYKLQNQLQKGMPDLDDFVDPRIRDMSKEERDKFHSIITVLFPLVVILWFVFLFYKIYEDLIIG